MLTKSNYLLGLQCLKLLWNKKHKPEIFPETSEMDKAKFKGGELIGELAKKIFLDGKDLSQLELEENLEKTKELLEKRIPLFEAGFLVDNLFSRADILFPTGNDSSKDDSGEPKWDIIEVKSATKIKDVNIHDVSFQKYVYEKAGLKIRKCFILHVNSGYVKNGEIEPNEYFVKTDITEKVEEFSLGIKERIDEMLKIINTNEEPSISIGIHCSNPYDCSLTNECWKEIPEGSIFEFYRILKKKSFELYNSGITKINEVPDSVKLNDKQKIQRQLAASKGVPLEISGEISTRGKRIHKDEEKIKNFLDSLEYPIYYLDFETINPAIPKYDGMKPYQRIPFQFSLHIQQTPNGELKHISFLSEGISDPRPKFMEALKNNLGKTGNILVYNQAFEKGVLKESSEALPEYQKWLDTINPRIKDLWDVFRNFWYYDPKQKGSASIKAVLPVLSNLSHKDLEITKGDIASYEWERITFLEEVSEEEKLKVRDALEKYCELDTLAEVEIVRGLGG